MAPLDPHWSFAQSVARIGIELLLRNPTVRVERMVYLDVADAFSRDMRLSDRQRQRWQLLHGRLREHAPVEQHAEGPDATCAN